MVQSVIQHSFHAGEWAPNLYARVDLAKYRAGAALLENFYVDYRGGASSRPGTKYSLQAKDSSHVVRLIPFQASTTVGYILEFGHHYIRFHYHGSPLLETTDTTSIATITNVSGTIITAGNVYSVGDWVYIEGALGINEINNRYWIVDSATPVAFSVSDLFGSPQTFSGTYVSGGNAWRVYTLPTPYDANDLKYLKFTQSIDKLFLVHQNYPPSILTIIAADVWTLHPMVFGSTVGSPTGLAATTTNAGSAHYGYSITALDDSNQESAPTDVVYQTVNIIAGTYSTINLTWTPVTGAGSYNVYRTVSRDGADPPAGTMLGYVMNVTQAAASDAYVGASSQNLADFSQSVPIPKNPFGPPGVASAIVTAPGDYTGLVTPGVIIAPPTTGITATATATLGVQTMVPNGATTWSAGWNVGDIVHFDATKFVSGVAGVVASVTAPGGAITGYEAMTFDGASPGAFFGTGITGTTVFAKNPAANQYVVATVTWGVVSVNIVQHGSGYEVPPLITFDAGAAAATAVLEVDNGGNPSCVGLHQQRLVLAAKPTAVQTFDMSQPGSYFNFDIRNPIQADDAIEATLVDGQLNKIVSMVSVPTGLLMLTSRANWLVSGAQGGPVSPIDIQAHAHSYNGSSDVPPLVCNFDVLFVQNKGSVVRDLAFNFYTQIFTGTDISVLSSHLFYGHLVDEWCWAEEPFKVVWAVRGDGVVLSLTYLKEQELIGWSHSVTDGLFRSTATVCEVVEDTGDFKDAVYFVVERVINGQNVKYIERLGERLFTGGASDAWCVDSGLAYEGPPLSNFTGAEHLGNQVVTGLADGVPIEPFVMPYTGNFGLAVPASKVVIGLGYECRLKTLPLDTGEPTVQGKRKGINGVTVRVQDTLGLEIGKDFDTTIVMKDLVPGNVGSATNEVVVGLLTADARTIIDPSWDVPGQYCIKQPLPLPATILGVIPEIEIGDTK